MKIILVKLTMKSLSLPFIRQNIMYSQNNAITLTKSILKLFHITIDKECEQSAQIRSEKYVTALITQITRTYGNFSFSY